MPKICQKCGGWEHLCDRLGHIGEEMKNSFDKAYKASVKELLELKEEEQNPMQRCPKCGGYEALCKGAGHIGEVSNEIPSELKKKSRNFKLPFIGNFAGAVEVSEKQRDEYVNEVFEYFENNPDEPLYYVGTGDTIIFGVNHDDEILVMDTKIRREYNVTKED